MKPQSAGCMYGLVFFVILILLAVQVFGRTEPNPETLLQSRKLKPLTKAPVSFSHSTHEAAGVECLKCHHEYTGGRNQWRPGMPVQSCEVCHTLETVGRRLDLKNAFHHQCKGCHLKLRQHSRAAGPIRCQDCHRVP
ncbi:cytochrome c3 family protein [Desulfobacca acetoxidans]